MIDAPNVEPTWLPSEEYLAVSRIRSFCEANQLAGYQELVHWAAADVGRYWDAVVRDLGLHFDPPYVAPVEMANGAAWPEWFTGGGFNYVTNILDRNIGAGLGEKTAIVWEGDGGETRTLTFDKLSAETSRFANGLRQLGVKKGDRLGILLPMIPETVVAVLACGMIGAIFIPMFSGYGEEAIASRLRDCEATMLITADGFHRRGAVVPLKQTADAALRSAPTVTTCVVFNRLGITFDLTPGRDIWWSDVVANQSDQARYELTAANDPFMVIYTSGTTGKPKGAFHVHAGFPIKAAHDLAYCFDLKRDDTIFWLTDLGWMMGPWLISGALMLGATITIFEGTPDYPNPDRIWEMVERYRVTVLGVAPTAIRALMVQGDEWVDRHDLFSLRVLGSTGEPWNPAPWRWYFERIGKGRLPIINYSGGTETGGGILGCVTTEPIRSCAFTGPVPGMAADVVDDSGNPVRGEVGELIVRQPWVGMTRGFWGDDERYVETYWSRIADVWVHGDWAEIDEDGFWFIRGRSDDTLKVAGKRIGPAEVESAAVSYHSVQEAAAIGIPDQIKGESVVVFAVLKPGGVSDDRQAQALRQHIGQQLGAAMRPKLVVFVAELPRTRNAKIMRRVIRAAYLGLPTGDLTALENPSAVEFIAAMKNGQ